MTQVFGPELNGSNCQLSGQTIISLSASEDIDADYDTAACVTLAPSGKHGPGAEVQTIEGGVSTGWWVVEDAVVQRSGEKTWRRRSGSAGFAHLPLVSYRLKRKGYHQARSTLSRPNLGADNFPLKFWTGTHYQHVFNEIQNKVYRGEVSYWDAMKIMEGMRIANSGADVIRILCGLVGLPVLFRASCPFMVEEYIPVNKPVITACREVASWSGSSVMLDRSGTLLVYDWSEEFGRSTAFPHPAAVLESETHDGLYEVTAVTVVGERYEWSAETPQGGLYLEWRKTALPVEVTESMVTPDGVRPVEERIEIKEYPITPELGRRIARERLGRAVLRAGLVRLRGPAEGSQGIYPLAAGTNGHVFSLTRTLEWTGTMYKYEIDLSCPQSAILWSSPPAPAVGPTPPGDGGSPQARAATYYPHIPVS